MHHPAFVDFAGWIQSTALPFFTAFLEHGPEVAVVTLRAMPPDHPSYGTHPFVPLRWTFTQNDALVGQDLNPQSWHSAHRQVALRTLFAERDSFARTFYEHLSTCLAFTQRTDVSGLVVFRRTTDTMTCSCRIFVRGHPNLLVRKPCTTPDEMESLFCDPVLLNLTQRETEGH